MKNPRTRMYITKAVLVISAIVLSGFLDDTIGVTGIQGKIFDVVPWILALVAGLLYVFWQLNTLISA